MTRSALALACSLALAPAALAEPLTPDQVFAKLHHPELGDVDWSRDFEATIDAAKESGKPVLVLFQEVPGCHTCITYGQEILSNPLLVEASETLFHPVAIFNNVDGKDRTVLTYFKEPTWNNPVVRVIDAELNMLAPRVSDEYSTAGITKAMIAALDKAGRDVPAYLRLLSEEAQINAKPLATATFAMHCFWEGQAQLGSLPGVIETECGWLDGLEIVDVEYDPERISYDELLDRAQSMQCASKVFARTDNQLKIATRAVGDRAVRSDDEARRVPKDELYRLQHSTWNHVPMTPLQAEKANAALGLGQDPTPLFSPAQLRYHEIVLKYPDREWKVPTPKHNLDGQMNYAQIYEDAMQRVKSGDAG